MKTNISLEEAQEILFNHCPNIGKQNCDLDDSLSRVLCEDVKALENIPPFARFLTMDMHFVRRTRSRP